MTDVSVIDLDQDWVPKDSFAARLALIRIELGWNISQAAGVCDIDAETWRGWEKGRSPHRLHDIARKIADCTGANYQWLVAGGPLRSRCFASVAPIPGQMALALGVERPVLAAV